jgi:hypothetical protein
MKKTLLLALVAACGQKSNAASPTPIARADAAVAVPSIDAGPDQPGELPMADVETAMAPVKQSIEDDCAAKTDFQGTTKVIITIHPDGSCVAQLEATSGMASVDQCMIDDIDKAKFPTSERGQRFHYSFRFK